MAITGLPHAESDVDGIRPAVLASLLLCQKVPLHEPIVGPPVVVAVDHDDMWSWELSQRRVVSQNARTKEERHEDGKPSSTSGDDPDESHTHAPLSPKRDFVVARLSKRRGH
jgi:hypothetical protein